LTTNIPQPETEFCVKFATGTIAKAVFVEINPMKNKIYRYLSILYFKELTN
jgi:hypothetical protein